MAGRTANFTWQFHRLGGLDQLTLRTAEELTHLGELNPKLWVALSCPASGLEYDKRTLDLIDADKDGKIRIPEVLHTVSWLTARLADPASMAGAPQELPLDAIKTDSPEGARLLVTAKSVLAALGKPEAAALSHADALKAFEASEKNTFNGDGIISAREDFDEDVRAFITDAIAVVGGVKGADGETGVNRETAEAFAATMRAWQSWRETVDNTATPLGDATAEAWNLMCELAPKIEDYFLRTEMAAFAPLSCREQAGDDGPRFAETGLMEKSALADMPIARIDPDRPLAFDKGVNPAWRKRLARFGTLVRPLLRDENEISRADWEGLQSTFAPYEAALAQKPAAPAVTVTVPPTTPIEQTDAQRAARHLGGNVLERVLELIATDAAAPAAATDIADLERMVLFHANLHRLLMNFVSFHDFYSLRDKATFQSGTLYLDGRSCRLCLPVTGNIAAHSRLATLSQLFLAYCECSRVKEGPGNETETMSIVAAVTAGSSDMLVEGRNGVFVDSAGRDWAATVTKVVANPISIRQSAWEPYKRLARTIGSQVAKFAASKQTDVAKNLGTQAGSAAASKPPSFDIGKSMGIFAAIGLALGAIGTAMASIASALFALSWHQIPLVILGVFLLISGPSMILAWLKLRKRTLGPLLEASGWAVNSVIPINLTLGRQLTGIPVLPQNARRFFNDPLRKPRRWPFALALALALAAALGAYLFFSGSFPFTPPPAP